MQQAAKVEGIQLSIIQKKLSEGTLVIAANEIHLKKDLLQISIGKVSSVKINANIGSSRI